MLGADSPFAEANARLLIDLMTRFSAQGLGVISNFFNVAHHWRCPCCYRTKDQFARLDKNYNLLCSIVFHHDHFVEHVAEIADLSNVADYQLRHALGEGLVRFPDTPICSDCNVAEPAAKRIVEAPSFFSFAPYEIAGFIIVTDNAPHEVDAERARAMYESARPAMRVLYDRVRAIAKARSENVDGWEPIAGPAWRVLKDAHRKMKDAAE